jgi:hypothetical protein
MASRPASVASRGSTLSKYHTVAKTSQVDESLFGSSKLQRNTKAHPQNVATIDNSTGTKQPEVVALSKGQLTKMMSASPILTASQAQELNKVAHEARDKERAKSNARKARMLALEQERKKQVRQWLLQLPWIRLLTYWQIYMLAHLRYPISAADSSSSCALLAWAAKCACLEFADAADRD